MSSPLVSVIVPVFNGRRFLAETLASVRAQTYTPIELIVVDDGSTDGSGDIIRACPGACCITQPNRGVAAARNAGLDAAQGELLAFIDQDDLWPADSVARRAGFLLVHPEVDYVLSMVQFFLEPEIEKPAWVREELLARPVPGYSLGNMVIRRAAFARVGRFDTRFVLASDHDWFVRAADLGLAQGRLGDVLLLKRTHDENESRRGATREMLLIHRESVQRKQAAAALASTPAAR
jgi:glycosyltransferase involved in cell wall biosynthesis